MESIQQEQDAIQVQSHSNVESQVPDMDFDRKTRVQQPAR